eukprot:COSAG06_NODE_2167_length_7426_cov_7.331787_11_plen_397_part_00
MACGLPQTTGGRGRINAAVDPTLAGNPPTVGAASVLLSGASRGLSTPVRAADRGLCAADRHSALRSVPPTMFAAGYVTWPVRAAPSPRSSPRSPRRALVGPAARAGRRCGGVRQNQPKLKMPLFDLLKTLGLLHAAAALGLSVPPYYVAGDYRPLERRVFVHPLLEHVDVELPVSYVERAGDEWEFVCRGFQEVPWQSCGGVGGGYRVGPWRLPAAVSPPWPLVTPVAVGPARPGPNGRERLVLLWRLWQKYMVIVAMHRAAVDVRENSRLADGGAFIGAVRRALASGRWVSPVAADNALTAVEFYHPGSTNSGLVHVCTARLEGVVDADFIANFHWSANTPAISVRGVRLRWVVFGAELPAPGTCLLVGSRSPDRTQRYHTLRALSSHTRAHSTD